MHTTSHLQKQLDFLCELDKAKTILRNTILLDQSRRENDAEHSWHMAVAAIILTEYADEPFDLLKAVKMALIHDIVEIDAGDVWAYATVDKNQREADEERAARRIAEILPEDQAKEVLELWLEFDRGSSPEARYARAMDRLMPVLHNYKTCGVRWREMGVTRKMVLERNGRIAEASTALWDYVQAIIDDAVTKGYLHE